MKRKINRRNFLKTSAAFAGISILNPGTVFGTKANSAIRLGLIGCGNRGTRVASSFMENTDTQIVALADIFKDKLDIGREHFDKLCEKKGFKRLEDSHLFSGSKGYLGLLNLKDVDAVQISTPTFLHAEQLETAVSAGKHVYCEKPAAVDVHGCKRVIKTGEEAKGHVSLAIGLQIRHATPFIELVKRIHSGAIGEIVLGQAYYLSSSSSKKPATSELSVDEMRLRNFYSYRELGGGCILDQGVHPIDVCNWILKAHPTKASAIGGRKGREDDGNIWSYFAVNFEYPDNVPLAFQETQFGKGYFSVSEKFYGTKGISESHYQGGVFIEGENKWDSGVPRSRIGKITDEERSSGQFKSALEDADPNKQKAFIESIKNGNYVNEAKQGAESTLSAILARTSAYSGEEVTWEELIASDEKWDPMINLSQFRGK